MIQVVVTAPPEASLDYTERYMVDVVNVLHERLPGTNQMWQMVLTNGGFGGMTFVDFDDRDLSVQEMLPMAFGALSSVSGLNTFILINSRRYVWDVVLSIFMIGATIVTNYLLIPVYGIDGAALATMLNLIFINLMRTVLTYGFFRLQPFSWRMLTVLAISGGAFLAQYFIPQLNNVFLSSYSRDFR